MGKEMALKFIQELAGSIKPKSSKFLSKQAKDIEIFGEKTVERMNVSDEMLEVFTPFRRLSNKKCTLSDPKYFITEFEKKIGKDNLPINWQGLSDEKKLDYIVHERYSRLVANKIMNKIQNEPIEHTFQLDEAGEVVAYNKGDSDSVVDILSYGKQFLESLNIKLELPKAKIDIHNHPDGRKISAFSSSDISHYNANQLKGYMVDSAGNKFSYTPKKGSNLSDAVEVGFVYEEKMQRYKRTVMEHLDKISEKIISLQARGEEISKELKEEFAKWYHKMDVLSTGKDLTYMNDILSSESMIKYGQFKKLT